MIRAIKTVLIVAFVALGLAAVAGGELPAKVVDAAPEARLEPSRSLPGKVLHESDILAAPTDIEMMGLSLVIADDFAERPLHLMRRSDGTIERSFGGKGAGPREFESAWTIDVIDPAGEFMVLDPALQRVTWVDIKEDFRDGAWVGDRTVKLKANATLLETSWTPGGMFGLGFFAEGRLAHLDRDGALVRTTGPTPMDGMEVPPEVRQQAYQSKLKPNPSRTRWAVGTRYADRLEIYDRSGALVAEGARPYRFEPVYAVSTSGQAVRMTSDDDTRFGYIDLATTDDHIYALFSGRTRGQGRANYANTVHVFDWDGKLVDVIRLGDHVIALTVDPEGKKLYGVRHDPFPGVIEFWL